MTPDDLIARLNVEDAEAHLTPNEGAWFVSVTRYHNGHRYSHSVRIPLDPAESDLENAREVFSYWWAETIKDQIP